MSLTSRHSRLALVAALLAAGGCSGDVSLPDPPTLSIVAGDQQSALAATELPQHVVVQVRDGREQPIPSARVSWAPSPSGHDSILPLDSVTDGEGKVAARWVLDTVTGMHMLDVRAAGGRVAQASAYANPRPFSDVVSLPLQTYEGSGEVVHPDFVRLPTAWPGDPFRLVATPYPGGNQSYENPSFFTGSSGTSWAIPPGATNPLVTPLTGYYSDPDALYDPDANELCIYFRYVKDDNVIWMIHSSDGVRWSAPLLTLRAPNHMIVSPSIVRRSESEWMMWSGNAGTQGCGGPSTTVELRRSLDGIYWTNPETASLDERDGFAWHIDVEWIPSREEYWAVYPIKQAGSCVTDRLGFATSADGVHWRSYPSPLLLKGANDELRDIIYRSSIDYDAATGIVSLWYSGATYTGGIPQFSWHLAWERMSMSALFARVNVPAWEAARVNAPVDRPQLTNETAP